MCVRKKIVEIPNPKSSRDLRRSAPSKPPDLTQVVLDRLRSVDIVCLVGTSTEEFNTGRIATG